MCYINFVRSVGLKCEVKQMSDLDANMILVDKADVQTELMLLPPAQPERKGKWIPVTNGRGGFECNQCHCYAPSYQDGVEWLSAFCPNCGAMMIEGESE